MRIPKEEYNKAERILKQNNYNRIKIMNIKDEIFNISSPIIDGMPHAQNKISDSTYSKFIQLYENPDFIKAIKENDIVDLVLTKCSDKAKEFFEMFYCKKMSKFEIMEKGFSEREFFRKKSELIYLVYDEMKKK